MIIGSLFSGIGGLELGLEWSGLGSVVWQVEKDPFCRGVLAKHWPDVERFENVKRVGKHNLAPVDLICGGFPCQDISSAGKGAGLAGSRSGLWFEYLRIIKELRPSWVVVENVASGSRRWVDPVIACLDESGYETLPIPLSAKDVGAPHLRKRIFLIAHAKRQQLWIQPGRGSGPSGQSTPLVSEHGEAGAFSDAYRDSQPAITEHGEVAGLQSLAGSSGWNGRPPEPVFRGVDDGFPDRTHRLRALGNAVVPQCAEVIGHLIQELVKTEYGQ